MRKNGGLNVEMASYLYQWLRWLNFFLAFYINDPCHRLVIQEDCVAILGSLIAASMIVLSYQNPVFDSIGSIVIGGLLGFVAVGSIKHSIPYLLGKGLDDEIKDSIKQILLSDPVIK